MAYSVQQGLQIESANTVLAGPASGAATYPTFRLLGSIDVPVGGVNAQVNSYVVQPSDTGKLVSITSASATTMTLINPPPSTQFMMWVENVGAGALTINPNGLNLDGSASSLVLTQGQGIYISTDGSNYFTSRGMASGGVNAQTVSYLAVEGDYGRLVSMNGSSVTLTLPATPPRKNWWIAVENINATALTISRNGLNIDGHASNLSLTQDTGVFIFTDGTNYFTSRGMGSSSGSSVGGVNSQTVSYLALAGDTGKLISMNGTNLTLTLPAAAPSSTWFIFVENLNSTNLTVDRNGLTIDGASANLTVAQNQGLIIFADGSNYFTCRGEGSGSSGVTLETNGTPNGSQTLLNLKNGTGISIVDDGVGGVTINDTNVADQLQVNGTAAVNPFSITALVNGAGPVGVTEANGRVLRNNFPAMVENTQVNLSSNTQRVLGTVYQNNTGFPIYVQIVLVSTGATPIVLTASSDTSTSPTTVVSKMVTPNTNSTGGIAFFVAAGAYYKVTNSTGTPTVFSWREFQLMAGTFTDSGDLSGSKALATVYQNTTTSLKFIVVQVATVNTNSSVQGISDAGPSPTNVVADGTQTSNAANTTTVLFIVPPGHYYKVTAASGSLSIWHEYTWTVPVKKSLDLALTTGSGQTRSHQAISQTANSGTASVTSIQLQNWINNGGLVRWVSVVMTNGSTIANAKMFAGDGVPPYLTLSFVSQNAANAPRNVFGPVLSGKTYTIFDDTGGTTTLSHWWEYDIG